MKENIIYNLLLKKGIKIDYDVFEYGSLIMKRYLTVLVFVFPLAIILNIFFEVIISLFLFTSIRKYLGGFHLNNNLSCLIFSVISALAIPLISKYYQVNFSFVLFLLFTDIFLTFFIGPMDHENKRMSVSEKETYKKRALITEVVYIIVSLLLYYFNFLNFTFLIIYSITFNNLSIFFAYIKKHIFSNQKSL